MGKKVLKGTGIGICAIVAVFLFGYVFQMLWNTLIPDLFQGPEITYWQGIGLIVLGKLMTGGFGSGMSCGCDCKKKKNSGWKSSCDNKTEEEKAEMKKKFKQKFQKWTDVPAED